MRKPERIPKGTRLADVSNEDGPAQF